MGKDKVEKKEKRDKKEKRSEKDGVHKKEKKEKKSKHLKDAVEKELTDKVLEGLDQQRTEEKPVNGDVQVADADQMDIESRPAGAIVPFASPLVEDKAAKKVLKSVKKGKFLESPAFTEHHLRLLLVHFPSRAPTDCHYMWSWWHWIQN